MALAAALPVALLASATPVLWAGFSEDVDVRGLRPAREVKRVLHQAAPSLQACARADGTVVADVEILAAGFVDHVAIFGDDAVAAPCFTDALHRLPFADRGKEPPTHAVIRFVVGPAPPPGTSPADLALVVDALQDDLDRCVAAARKRNPGLTGTVVAHLLLRPDGAVARVEADAGTMPNQRARTCVAHVLSGARFAGGRTVEARVVIPLAFGEPRRASRPAKPVSLLEAPTLFDGLGCGGVF